MQLIWISNGKKKEKNHKYLLNTHESLVLYSIIRTHCIPFALLHLHGGKTGDSLK